MADGGPKWSVFELRPMNLADLLDAVIRIYRRRFATLIAICAVVMVPLGALQVVVTAPLVLSQTGGEWESNMPAMGPAMFIGTGFVFILLWLTTPLMQGAMAKAVGQYYLGAEAGVWDSYRFALRRWPTLLGVTLLVTFIIWGAAMIVMLPLMALAGAALTMGSGGSTGLTAALGLAAVVAMVGLMLVAIYLSVKLWFIGPLVVVLEDAGAIEALTRSWQLTNLHFWRVAVTMTVLSLMVLIAQQIISSPLTIAMQFSGGEMPSEVMLAGAQALGALARVLTQPVVIVGSVLLYYDLRIRKEGFDLVAMAEALGEPELAVRTAAGEARPALFATPSEPTDAEPTGPPAAEDTDEP